MLLVVVGGGGFYWLLLAVADCCFCCSPIAVVVIVVGWCLVGLFVSGGVALDFVGFKNSAYMFGSFSIYHPPREQQ